MAFRDGPKYELCVQGNWTGERKKWYPKKWHVVINETDCEDEGSACRRQVRCLHGVIYTPRHHCLMLPSQSGGTNSQVCSQIRQLCEQFPSYTCWHALGIARYLPLSPEATGDLISQQPHWFSTSFSWPSIQVPHCPLITFIFKPSHLIPVFVCFKGTWEGLSRCPWGGRFWVRGWGKQCHPNILECNSSCVIIRSVF